MVALGVAAAAGGARLATSPTLHVAVGPPLAGLPPVAPNFVGFSVEIYNIEAMIGRAGGKPSHSYAQLLRNLYSLSAGPHAGPTLRLGGNSAEQTCFVAAGAALPHRVKTIDTQSLHTKSGNARC